MNDHCWFLHEMDDRYNPPRDNGYWEIKYYNTEDEKPQVGEKVRLENACGGGHYTTIHENDILVWDTWEHVEYLYYSNNQKADYGWIDFEGKFYGCDYMGHAGCAGACFNLSEWEAEQAGYVKIYSDPILAKYDDIRFRPDGLGWYCSHKLTNAQKSTLLERGFKVDEDE